jgi:hypothetical protein
MLESLLIFFCSKYTLAKVSVIKNEVSVPCDSKVMVEAACSFTGEILDLLE